jgi:heme exporter protein C
MYGTRLRNLSIATAVFLVTAFVLAAFTAPLEADQGFSQKIFYVHVPLAIVALGGWVWGAVMGIQYLRTGEKHYDLRSYVAIHTSIVFGCAVLLTGAIWAKAAWGHWFDWSEATLVSFLIVFLLYCTYQPLRFSIEDPERQSRVASVFAVVAGTFVPLNFLAVRLAKEYLHPHVLNQAGSDLPAGMKAPFYLACIGMALLFATLYKFELTHKHSRAQLRALRRKLGDDSGARVGRTAQPQLEA